MQIVEEPAVEGPHNCKNYMTDGGDTMVIGGALVIENSAMVIGFRVIPGLTVTTAHVIFCGDDRFEITSVEDVKGRGMYIEVLAKKVTPSG